MTIHIFKRTIKNRSDNPLPELLEKNLANLSDAQKRMQEIIEENNFTNKGFDDEDNSWWARHKAPYPRYHFFTGDDNFLKILSSKK